MKDHQTQSHPISEARAGSPPGQAQEERSPPRSIPRMKHEFIREFYQQAVIGSLMAGLAHEFLNPLGFVQANLSSMKRYAAMITDFLGDIGQRARTTGPVDTDTFQTFVEAHHIDFVLEDVNDVVSQSQEGMDRIQNLLASLRSFVTPTREPVSEVDLDQVLHSVMGLAWNRVKYKAKVKREICTSVPAFTGQPGQIAQAILSVLLNAVEAIETNGTITIRVETTARDIIIQLSDDGCGIHADHLDRIFDPYFSAWKSGRRLGLGLTLARNTIDQHGGEITVQSTSQHGSTFTLRLPREQP